MATEAQKAANREAMDAQARRMAKQELRYRRRLGRYQAWEDQADALRDLVPKALAALGEALADRADPKQRTTVALAVLRAAGLWGMDAPQQPMRWDPLNDDSDLELELPEEPPEA